ncbi:MAG: YkvA family protein [Peptococcaceae bacterium]|nr:YkvA family protein [Peptococcaceae bacterium]
MALKEKAEKLKADVPAVFLALRKKETPFLAKLLAGLTVAYALSPIDLIPDFIPLLGYLDDLILLPGLVALTVRCIPRDVFTQCQIESRDLWVKGKPQKWYYALPIAAFWLLILYYLLSGKSL